jgi:hypothetical protein
MPTTGDTLRDLQFVHLPGAEQEQAIAKQHQGLARKQAGLLAAVDGQVFDQRVDPQVPLLAHGDHGADVGEPDEAVARHFVGHGDAGVEAVAQHHVAEHHDHHGHHAGDHKEFEQLEKQVDGLFKTGLRRV